MTDQLGGLVMIALVFLLAVICLCTRLPGQLRWLVIGGLLMRIVGVVAMLAIIFGVYNGNADAVTYFNRGSEYAERMLAGDLRMWSGDLWWGTHAVSLISGIALVVIGPGSFGTYLLFSLLAFGGLCLFTVAFARSYPHVPVSRYVRWLFFFPSLWLWPSVIGKEALILLGFGLLAYGYFRRGTVAWVPSIAGMLLIFTIRPQVAAVVAFSVVLAEWLSKNRPWSFLRVAQGAVILGMGVFMIPAAMSLVGGEASLRGVGEYIELRQTRIDVGESNIEVAGGGIMAIPKAFLTTLFRPYPWEAKSPMLMGSGLEIWFFWLVALFRGRRIVAALREWRSTRFMTMGLLFVLVYAVTFGMVVYNLGIVARQRIFLFPFLFALLEIVPAPARQHRKARSAPEARRLAPHPIPEHAA